MFNLGPMEVLVIVVVALLVLGPQRLPEAMRQVGKGVGEVRRWSSQLTNEVQSAFVAEPAPAPTYPTLTTDAEPVATGEPGTVAAPAPGADAVAGGIGA